jgi:hypothetical protein
MVIATFADAGYLHNHMIGRTGDCHSHRIGWLPVGIIGSVGRRARDDHVYGALDLRGEPLRWNLGDLDWDSRQLGDRLQRRGQARLLEDHREDSVRDLTELCKCGAGLSDRDGKRPGLLPVSLTLRLRRDPEQLVDDHHEVQLGAVMQVTFEAAAGLIAGLYDSGAG